MNKDYEILRSLSARYIEYAMSDTNLKNMELHKCVNDMRPGKPVVIIDEIPWHEMELEDELTLRCEDEHLRALELRLRQYMYRWEHMRGDMVLPPYLGVYKVVHISDIGVQAATNDVRAGDDIKSHTYADQLPDEASLAKLHNYEITYDEALTNQRMAQVAEAVGDILPVKAMGLESGYGSACKTWDDIVLYRGLDTLFYDLVERPEFIHKLMTRLTDIYVDMVHQIDEMGLWEANAYYNHSTCALTNDLHPDYTHPTAKGVWGRGLAQIFASVSPEMHDEFDTQYMIRAMEPYGLVYYGCCEPLDKKIHIIEKIPNLRKISVTPWADVDVATDAIAGRYVVSAKPNPSALSTPTLDTDAVRRELTHIVEACRRNNCTFELVLKDITTVCNRPQNLFEWERIAMEVTQG